MVEELQNQSNGNTVTVLNELMKTEGLINQIIHFLRNEHREEKAYKTINPTTNEEEVVFRNEWIQGKPLANEEGISFIVRTIVQKINNVVLLSTISKDEARVMERLALLDLDDHLFLQVEKYEIDPLEANLICSTLEDLFIAVVNRTISKTPISDKELIEHVTSENRGINNTPQQSGILSGMSTKAKGLFGR